MCISSIDGASAIFSASALKCAPACVRVRPYPARREIDGEAIALGQFDDVCAGHASSLHFNAGKRSAWRS